MVGLPIEIQVMMAEMAAAGREREAQAARADPVKHKLTMIFPDGEGPRWRYYGGGVDPRGVQRKFCWTTNRNVAGYFLSFAEVYHTKRGRGERVKFVASRSRTKAKARALRLYQAHQKHRQRK